MTARRCLDCRALCLTTRCPACSVKRSMVRNATRPQYRGTWPAERALILRAWLEVKGPWCPGYRRPPHTSTDLTVDHLADGGRGVLCRSCNGRKGAIEPVFTKGHTK